MNAPHRGSTTATTIIAAVVAVALVFGIIALTLINPYASIGLPPVLFAVAAIVRAVTGTPSPARRGRAPHGGRRDLRPRRQLYRAVSGTDD